MISLSRAMLCVNCELISETERDCPNCGSKQLMAVVQMLGGSLLNQAKNPSAALRNETQAPESSGSEGQKTGEPLANSLSDSLSQT